MISRYRERGDPVHSVRLGQWCSYRPNGVLYNTQYANYNAYSSYRERCWDELHPGPPYRSGGPLTLLKYTGPLQAGPIEKWITLALGYKQSYTGYLLPYPLSCANWYSIGDSGSQWTSDWGDPSSVGASAWNKFKPRLEFAQCGVMIAEFSDFPRMLKNTAKLFHSVWKGMGGHSFGGLMSPRGLANQFLNQQFGWKPFLSDLRDIFHTTEKFNRYYAQVKRDNGNWIRRRGTYLNDVGTQIITQGTTLAHTPGLANSKYYKAGTYPSGNDWTSSHQVVNDIWFEGKFRYWIPPMAEDTSPIAKARNALRTFGIRVSPSVLWEATPWSWLADWFSNAGDVISNLSSKSLDHVGAKYAYVMGHITDNYYRDIYVHFNDGDFYLPDRTVIEAKHRVEANPWGFNLSIGDLSATQIAILGALGILKF